MLRFLFFVPFLLLTACQPQPIDFEVVQHEEMPLVLHESLTVNNCGSLLCRPYWYTYDEVGQTVHTTNLQATGGEPHPAIRARMAFLYGTAHHESLWLTIPATTQRLYTFEVESTLYRGELRGNSLAIYKERPAMPIFYTYTLRQKVELVAEEDIPCP